MSRLVKHDGTGSLNSQIEKDLNLLFNGNNSYLRDKWQDIFNYVLHESCFRNDIIIPLKTNKFLICFFEGAKMYTYPFYNFSDNFIMFNYFVEEFLHVNKKFTD